MKHNIMEAWVEALRSGKYIQGQGRLAEGNKHCCLGVLCELAVDAGVIKKRQPDDAGIVYGLHSIISLPASVMEWAGVHSTHGLLTPANGSPIILSNENDEGKDFGEIANLIEHYWEIL